MRQSHAVSLDRSSPPARACPVCGAECSTPLLRVPAERLEARQSTPRREYQFVRCRRCEAAFLDAMPSAEELDAYYDEDGYHFDPSPRTATGLFRRLVLAARRAHLALARPLPNGLPGRHLDFGCGPGDYLDMTRSRGWRGIGVEHSAKSAARARSRGLDVVLEPDFQRLPARSCQFISMIHSLEHHSRPAELLSLLAEHLTPDGELLIEVPTLECWESRVFGRHYSMLQPPVHLQLFTDRTIHVLADRAGLALVRVRNNLLSPIYWVWSFLNAVEISSGITIGRRAKNLWSALLYPLTLPVTALEALVTGHSPIRQYLLVRKDRSAADRQAQR